MTFFDKYIFLTPWVLNEVKNITFALKNTRNALEESGISGEIIVINDGSEDRTEELVKGFMQVDKRARLINHDKS